MDHWRKALVATRSSEPKYKILAQVIAADIETGALADGARLAPQRELGDQLGISVQTVTNAYKELTRHGHIRCEVGRGSFVSKPVTQHVASYMLDHAEQKLVDFSIARIIHTPLHDDAWRKVCMDLAGEENQPWMRECRPIAGFESHRAAGITWLATLGMPASINTLMITNGASHGIFLALASLVNPGDLVLCENLSDHGVIGCSQVLGFDLKGLDIDEWGIQPDHFEDMCANERVTALVCTPNLNNPTAALMPDARRRAIARIAERHGVYVIEDDVYGPLLAQRAPPIASYLPDLGFYCTSFTKSVLSGLRTGYMNVPRRLALRADSILRVNSWMATPLLAEIAARWVWDGTAVNLVKIQRERLETRQTMVREALSEYMLGQHLTALSSWMRIPQGWQLDNLARQLRDRNIAVTLPDPFLVRGTLRPDAFRLCVGADVSDDKVRIALATMSTLFSQAIPVNDFN